MPNIGKLVGDILPFDPTPGFNINAHAGGGIPFVSKGNGSTGLPPAATPAPAAVKPKVDDTVPYDFTAPATDNYGGYASKSDQQAAAAAKLQIQQGLDSSNDAVGRLGNQEKIGYGNIDRDFQAAIDQLLGQSQIAERDYGTSRTGQVNDYIGARENNANNARAFLESGRRTLGAMGAGGGSAARYGVPLEAQTQASRSNAQAQGVNNKNLIALDTNMADTRDKFTNAERDVTRQRDQGKNDLTSKVASQRATLLNTIAQLTGQLNIANGGNTESALAASQGYTAQIPALLNQIDSLSATPAITPQAVTVNNPTLDGYNYARPDAPVVAAQDPTLTNNPVFAALFGNQDQKQQQSFIPATA